MPTYVHDWNILRSWQSFILGRDDDDGNLVVKRCLYWSPGSCIIVWLVLLVAKATGQTKHRASTQCRCFRSPRESSLVVLLLVHRLVSSLLESCDWSRENEPMTRASVVIQTRKLLVFSTVKSNIFALFTFSLLSCCTFRLCGCIFCIRNSKEPRR